MRSGTTTGSATFCFTIYSFLFSTSGTLTTTVGLGVSSMEAHRSHGSSVLYPHVLKVHLYTNIVGNINETIKWVNSLFLALFWSDKYHECVLGSGLSYRGTTSVTKSGSRCLPWDSPAIKHKVNNAWRSDALELGLGSHSFCRCQRTHRDETWKFPLSCRKIRKTQFFVAFILPLSNRNPDTDKGPWCYIYKNMQLTWELCDIPECGELHHNHTLIFK